MKLRIRRGDVTLVSNSVIEDCRLSWSARGVLLRMLAADEGCAIKIDGVEGELAELREFGYLVKRDDGNEVVIDELPGGCE